MDLHPIVDCKISSDLTKDGYFQRSDIRRDSGIISNGYPSAANCDEAFYSAIDKKWFRATDLTSYAERLTQLGVCHVTLTVVFS